ncbi:MOSC domain-containing protein [Methyloversatilis thermotolerans]|uniref:MOSC domain-containing protein n=1 Tax=Methyloversatilis thermotolerans TaxID=1346290 RepID=UPI000475B58A|nr:MOSC domain-containing protein [Methyloversatilis thermotolerans]
MITLRQLYRYPIKGLSAEPMDQVALRAGEGLPLDRVYAITNGGWDYDPATYQPRPKTDFIALMSHAALAALTTHLDDEARRLTVRDASGECLEVDLDDAGGCADFARFVYGRLDARFEAPPAFVAGEGFRFTDVSVLSHGMMNAVSLINLATVRHMGEEWGVELDPLRFRANLYIDGAAPWEEAGWLDRELSIGEVRFKVVMRTPRCAATSVNPQTALRDMNLPATMMERYGHRDLGVYLQVVRGGSIAPGAELVIA